MSFRPTKIISGGQTGVDQGALAAALSMGYEIGGWCTVDRRTEDGEIPAEFPLEATDSPDYLVRTRLNVETADATVVATYEDEQKLTGGTQRTVEFCRAFECPHFVLTLERGADKGLNLAAAKAIRAWWDFLEPATVNFAGPRESRAPGIQAQVEEIVRFALQTRSRCLCGRETPDWVWLQAERKKQPVRCSQCGHVTYGSDLT